ncbi:hypothetical protein JCM19239_2671 [Vibrio variabilis]|uniref:Uncharacterized protein n=1 Tax=Vibrio variabilis TaxID=990271 RepID=A0ABQ0JNK6_9VIBR|nr:hypothetical protein JCM19239_2671 [Vibrio variabilis]
MSFLVVCSFELHLENTDDIDKAYVELSRLGFIALSILTFKVVFYFQIIPFLVLFLGLQQ